MKTHPIHTTSEPRFAVFDKSEAYKENPDGQTLSEWDSLLREHYRSLEEQLTEKNLRESDEVLGRQLTEGLRRTVQANSNAKPRIALPVNKGALIDVNPVKAALVRANAETDPTKRARAFAEASRLIKSKGN